MFGDNTPVGIRDNADVAVVAVDDTIRGHVPRVVTVGRERRSSPVGIPDIELEAEVTVREDTIITIVPIRVRRS